MSKSGLFAFIALFSCLVTGLLVWKQGATHYVTSESGEEEAEANNSFTPSAGSPFSFDQNSISESILLAGDAGDMRAETGELLKSQAALAPDRLTVIFLGDNIYSNGLPSPDSNQYPQAYERLMRQINAVKDSGARILFVPGNHDWDSAGQDGWESVKREQRAVEKFFGEKSYLPQGGCPGPAQLSPRPYFNLLSIDSEWWLHRFDKPIDASSGCATWSEDTIISSIHSALPDKEAAGKTVLIQHHPLVSFGSHSSSTGGQGLLSKEYTNFREKVISTLDRNRPFLCVAGHDHSLQVIEGKSGCRYYLVSGTMSHPTRIVSRPSELLFGSAEPGLMRIDRNNNGEIRVSVITPKENAAMGHVVFQKVLSD